MSAKTKIDEAAVDLFVRVGVDGATTKLIAAAAGISEGAIYRHYKSKDELALTLFMGAHRRLSSLVEAAAAGQSGIRAKAAAVVRAYCQAADENWPLFTFHMLSMHRFLPCYQEDGRDPVSTVEKLLKRAMIETEIPPADPRVLAAMAIGVIVQTAQNKAYGRIDTTLTAHAPLMTAAVQAILFAR
ncbi:MAG: TetR/AcrR family transcriptional regulator [Caulobacterales bacterium]